MAALLQQHRETVAVVAAAAVLLAVGLASLWWLHRGDPYAVTFGPESFTDAPEAERATPPAEEAGGPGTLLVTSIPSGATVFLDEEEAGATPLWLPDIESGAHTVTLRLPGFAPVDTALTLAPDRLQTFAFTLEQAGEGVPSALMYVPPPAGRPPPAPTPAPQTRPEPRTSQAQPSAPATGTLRVVVRPWGTISIDGSVRARETDVRYEERLQAGRHLVRATHPVLGTREVAVTLSPGETAQVEIDFNE